MMKKDLIFRNEYDNVYNCFGVIIGLYYGTDSYICE